MSFDPRNAINTIYNLKGMWDEADTAGDDAAKESIANQAKEYYQQLRDNGYGDTADRLSASNYKQAQSVKNAFEALGKTATRPYLQTLGTSYGLSADDVNKLITYNENTGEIGFGGKNLGRPDVEVNGTSYWNDTSSLDNAFNDYVKRAGLTKSYDQLAKENSLQVQNKMNDLFTTQASDRKMMTDKYSNLEDYNYNHNPYESEIGKSIMEDYKWKGAQASDNEVADGSSTNSGNIDSFSAANASRQQAAYTNAGRAAVLADFNARVNNAKDILGNMGVYLQGQDVGMQATIGLQQNEAQRMFDNDETAKNNALSREIAISDVTGLVPDSMKYTNNSFFKNGTLIDPNIDYQAIINNATEKLKTATDETEKANLRRTILEANEARNYKIINNPEYAQYAETMVVTAPQETAGYKLTNRELDNELESIYSAERIANGKISADILMNEQDNQTALNKAQISAANKSSGSSSSSNTSSSTTSSNKPPMTETQVNKWVKYFNGISDEMIKQTGYNQYKVDDKFRQRVVADVYNSNELTQEQKEYLLYEKFGLTERQIQQILDDEPGPWL